jgi:membrane protein
MRFDLRKYRGLFIQTCNEWIADDAQNMGASLAFYSMLSLAPLLLLVLAVAGIIFGPDAARGRIVSEIQDLMGEAGARAIQDMLLNSAQQKEAGFFAGLLGVAMLLFGASGFFAALQTAMNRIWDIRPKTGRGLRGFVYDRLLSFTMVLGTGFLLLVSLIISAGLSALNDFSMAYAPDFKFIMGGINFIVSFGIISLLFGLIFKCIPDAYIAWRDVFTGALITAFLFTVGKTAIGFYIGHSAFSSSYGAAGSLVVVLVWVYYSAQILFFGAELTQVHARRAGREIRPKPNALRINAKGGI